MVSLENRVGHTKLPREVFYLICPASGAEFTKKREGDMTKAEGFRRSVGPGGGKIGYQPKNESDRSSGQESEEAAKRYPTVDST